MTDDRKWVKNATTISGALFPICALELLLYCPICALERLSIIPLWRFAPFAGWLEY